LEKEKEEMKTPDNGPLEGLKVLDLTRMLPGPFCTMLLADLGAEVTIIEQAGGADIGPRRTNFHVDRNKKSLILNLKDARAKDIFYRLVSNADVVVEGFRPGVTARLKIDYPTLREINNGLIYCSISGYGQDGPYRTRVGHDINYIALSGLLSLTGKKDQDPVIPGTQIADVAGGGLMAANSILAALYFKEKTGQGQYIDVSMMDGVLSFNAVTLFEYFSTGKVPQRGTYRLLGSAPCYNVYRTKDDRHITIGALEPKFWANLCRKLSREDLIAKQYDASSESLEEVKQIFVSKTSAEWERLLESEDVCYAPVLNLEEAARNDQVLHRDMVVEMKEPGSKNLKQVGIVPKFSLTPGKIRIPPPTPGQHTHEILRGLGIGQEAISKLEEEQVVKGCPG